MGNYDAAQDSESSEPAIGLEQPLRCAHTRQGSDSSIAVTIAQASVLLRLSAFIAITSTAAVITNFTLAFFGVSESWSFAHAVANFTKDKQCNPAKRR